jgi:hypothetical protein
MIACTVQEVADRPKVETAMFITGVVLVAGGVVWATSG